MIRHPNGFETRFKKGQVPWNKGKKMSREYKEKCRQRAYAEINKGIRKNIFTKGHQLSIQSKEKMIKSLKNKKPWNTGRKLSEKHVMNLIKSHQDWGKKLKYIMRERRKRIIVPKCDTSIEIKIQNFLKELGVTFLTHQYIKEIEHGYQCDILIPAMNLVIECDGDYWHSYPTGREIDRIRTKELLGKGFKVLRLWEFEIKSLDINKFKERLHSYNGK